MNSKLGEKLLAFQKCFKNWKSIIFKFSECIVWRKHTPKVYQNCYLLHVTFMFLSLTPLYFEATERLKTNCMLYTHESLLLYRKIVLHHETVLPFLMKPKYHQCVVFIIIIFGCANL